MPAAPDPVVESAARLCETLERIGDALVALDVQTLLETEETLGRLLAALATEGPAHDPAALAPLVKRARQALVRCRRLGASFASVARVRLPLSTGIATYNRAGGFAERAVSGSAVEARV